MSTLAIPTTVAATESVADADITAAIKRLLRVKRGAALFHPHLLTQDGIVELTGFTDNLLAQQRAEEIVLAVRGVRGLVSKLTVQTADAPDAELQHSVAQALADDPATGGYMVTCRVANGLVTPVGTVQSWVEQQLVLRVLRGVRGVRHIAGEELVIRGGALLNSDEEMTTQVRELLDWDIRVNSALVVVRTADHVIHLTGTVGTAAEKAHATALAYQAGATRVDDRDLFVAYWALEPELRTTRFIARADADIAQAIRDTCRFSARVRAAELHVQVLDGVATLTGTVSSLRAKQEAEHNARHVAGVADVQNRLRIRLAQPVCDVDISRSVMMALGRDPYVGHYLFGVQVFSGQVLLTGQVASLVEQEQAGTVAAGASGVLGVNNRVQLPAAEVPGLPHPAVAPTDHALAEQIRESYQWSATLHGQPVEVQAENGRVTLTGTVDTWLDRQQAARAATDAGAREVNNHLHVLGAGLPVAS